MTQSILIPLGRSVATATISVPASADNRARIILFGEQRVWNAGVQVRRLTPVTGGGGPTDFLRGWEGSSLVLPGPGEYEVIRLESPLELGVVFETGTDTAGDSIDPDAPALTTASVMYVRDRASGDFKPPCSLDGNLYVRAQQIPPINPSILEVEVDETFTAMPSVSGAFVEVHNSTAYMLEYRWSGAGAAARLPSGGFVRIPLGGTTTSNLQWRAPGLDFKVKVTGLVYSLGANVPCGAM